MYNLKLLTLATKVLEFGPFLAMSFDFHYDHHNRHAVNQTSPITALSG